MISFSHFTQIIHNIIEDEIYSVGLGQKIVAEGSFLIFFVVNELDLYL